MNNNTQRGAIAWMASHPIAANLLMVLFIFGGFLVSLSIKKEYLPVSVFDIVNISVSYPGSTPTELEQSAVLPIENELTNIDSIKEITSWVSQGGATVRVELLDSSDTELAYQEIQQAVDRINTFPDNMERPRFSLASRVVDVMELIVHGELDPFHLKRLAESLEQRILQSPNITKIEMSGLPDEEIHIEVSQMNLQRYDLKLSDIAEHIRRSSIERSAGSVKTDGGEILVSVDNRRYWANEFSQLPLISSASGDKLLLSDIATVNEGFESSNHLITFDGSPGVRLRIYRVDNQTPESVASSVHAMWPELQTLLPQGVKLTITDDDGKTYKQRLNLLLKNAFIGLVLVMLLLSLFLEYRLAFWVVMGIPTAFLGALLFLPLFDVSINMISMFGFIIALGIVVDDAIIAGENIYEQMQEGVPFTEAATNGAKQIAMPLSFAILTNVLAFLPLLFTPGMIGKIFGVTPIVVICCFLISWIEALFILPHHLANLKKEPDSVLGKKLNRIQQHCDGSLRNFIKHYYQPLLTLSMRHSGLTLSICVTIMLLVFSYTASGRLGFGLWPRMEGDWAVSKAELPIDSSLQQTIAIRDQLEHAARTIAEKNEDLLVGIKSQINDTDVEVAMLLVPSEERDISSHEVVRQWRAALGNITGVKRLSFDAERGGHPQGSAAFSIELQHRDNKVLAAAGQELETYLSSLNGIADIGNNFSNGKKQFSIQLTPHGRALNLDEEDIARQLRHALYGAIAIRQQRQSNEVTVLVRLTKDERLYAEDVQRLLIQTPEGGYVPLFEIAAIGQQQAPQQIRRRDGQRIMQISADIEPRRQIPAIMSDLSQGLIPQLEEKYPGLIISYRGRQAEAQDSVSSLQSGLWITLLGIYVLLAIPFRSYLQPLMILAIIPFGAVGAILGHMILGYSLSVVSLQGMLALCGIVVNDSLILVDYANRLREKGHSIVDAAQLSAVRRFRPIVLTTLTTFGGLAPMFLETSRQAKFLVPMAVSLGFGILFTTLICLLMLPALYVVIEKRREHWKKLTTQHIQFDSNDQTQS